MQYNSLDKKEQRIAELYDMDCTCENTKNKHGECDRCYELYRLTDKYIDTTGHMGIAWLVREYVRYTKNAN